MPRKDVDTVPRHSVAVDTSELDSIKALKIHSLLNGIKAKDKGSCPPQITYTADSLTVNLLTEHIDEMLAIEGADLETILDRKIVQVNLDKDYTLYRIEFSSVFTGEIYYPLLYDKVLCKNSSNTFPINYRIEKDRKFIIPINLKCSIQKERGKTIIGINQYRHIGTGYNAEIRHFVFYDGNTEMVNEIVVETQSWLSIEKTMILREVKSISDDKLKVSVFAKKAKTQKRQIGYYEVGFDGVITAKKCYDSLYEQILYSTNMDTYKDVSGFLIRH